MSEAFDPIADTPESSMKLYARKTSSNSQKVLWFLTELGLDYDFVATGGDAGGLGSDAYVAMNPNPSSDTPSSPLTLCDAPLRWTGYSVAVRDRRFPSARVRNWTAEKRSDR